MARRSHRRRKHGFASWSIGKKLGVILGGTFAAVAATGVVLVASKMTKIETTELDTDKLNIAETSEEQETGYLNVALFGLDSREGDLGKGNRSDTMMIASLNKATGEVKLVSVYRDTLLKLDDGSYNKANAAYAFGGPEGAISMINRSMDMDISKYVAVNFNALVDVIDALGGLDITLTDAEVVHMNNYCVETSKDTGADYTKIEPEVAGTYHLNGVQAVSYSRIRYTGGGDFERTSRQRHVLELIAEKAQSASFSTLNKIIDKVFPQVSTNFTITEMIAYAKDIAKYKLGDSMGFPDNNSFDMLDVVGSVIIPETLTSNVEDVHKFLFGDDGYTISSNITDIEAGIREKCTHKATSDSEIESDDDYGSGSGTSNDYSNSGSSNSNYNNSYNNNYNNSYNNSGSSSGTGSGSGTGDSGDGSDYGDYGGGSDGDYSGEDYD